MPARHSPKFQAVQSLTISQAVLNSPARADSGSTVMGSVYSHYAYISHVHCTGAEGNCRPGLTSSLTPQGHFIFLREAGMKLDCIFIRVWRSDSWHFSINHWIDRKKCFPFAQSSDLFNSNCYRSVFRLYPYNIVADVTGVALVKPRGDFNTGNPE